MEPLSENDPLRALLGKARPVEPRPNFTQNVLRAIRQVPQSLALGERIRIWFGEMSMARLALGGAAAVAMVAALALHQPAPQASTVVERAPVTAQPQPQPMPSAQPAIHEVSASMILAATAEVGPAPASGDMDPMGLLLVHEDTSALTDSELALLLY